MYVGKLIQVLYTKFVKTCHLTYNIHEGSIRPTHKVTLTMKITKTTTKHLTKILHSSTIEGFRESNQVVEALLDMDRER